MGDMNNNSKFIYTQEDLAELLGTHIQTITALRESKCITFIKIGKRYITTKEFILDFFHDYANCDLSNKLLMIKAYEKINHIGSISWYVKDIGKQKEKYQ